MPLDSSPNDVSQEYELLNPEGVVNLQKMDINPHLDLASLGGKTVVLRSNGKHNSHNALNRIAELLTEEVKDIKLIRAWEALPETNATSQNMERSRRWAEKIAALEPALVIGASGD